MPVLQEILFGKQCVNTANIKASNYNNCIDKIRFKQNNQNSTQNENN